jgi:predicted nucleic acid-binding protein
MIVLDTNVVSEVIRAEPDPSVVAWLASRPSSSSLAWPLSPGIFLRT